MLGQNLRQLYESEGPAATVGKLAEALALGRTNRLDPAALRPEAFSLRELAEAFCGSAWIWALQPGRQQGPLGVIPLLEAGEGVDVSAFSNITGQIIYSKILEGWTQAATIAEKLVTFQDSNLDGEKFPWIGEIPGEGEDIHPGKEYPEAGFGEQYIETPSTTKRGLIVSVLKETVFFDRTGQVLRQAGTVGERIRKRRDKKIIDLVLGVTNSFKWKGTTYNTYQTAGTYWTNDFASEPLVDYKSIERAEVAFSRLTDPDTTNPIEVEARQLLVPRALLFTARRTIAATQVRTVYPGIATQGATAATSITAPGNVMMDSANPLDTYEVLTTPFLNARLVASGVSASDADGYWYIGDFPRAFGYVRNWDITVVQAPANAEAEFERDVVARFKASERGVPAVFDPRYVQRHKAAA